MGVLEAGRCEAINTGWLKETPSLVGDMQGRRDARGRVKERLLG